MKNKVLKIVLDMVLSIVVLTLVMVAGSSIAGKILGYTKDAHGMEKINGGGATTITLFTIGIVLTLVFATWFYRFLSNYKVSKVRE